MKRIVQLIGILALVVAVSIPDAEAGRRSRGSHGSYGSSGGRGSSGGYTRVKVRRVRSRGSSGGSSRGYGSNGSSGGSYSSSGGGYVVHSSHSFGGSYYTHNSYPSRTVNYGGSSTYYSQRSSSYPSQSVVYSGRSTSSQIVRSNPVIVHRSSTQPSYSSHPIVRTTPSSRPVITHRSAPVVKKGAPIVRKPAPVVRKAAPKPAPIVKTPVEKPKADVAETKPVKKAETKPAPVVQKPVEKPKAVVAEAKPVKKAEPKPAEKKQEVDVAARKPVIKPDVAIAEKTSPVSLSREVIKPAEPTPGERVFLANPTEPAVLVVHVPADASVYLSGRKMSIEGPTRRFRIPISEAGRQYRYPIRVECKRNGKMLTTEQSEVVEAGRVITVSVSETELRRQSKIASR